MHTVFVNDKPLRFVNAYESEEWKGNTDSIFVSEKVSSIAEVLEDLEEAASHPGMIYLAANADSAWKVFVSYCQLVEAAGGLVINPDKKMLMIFRRGKWDLPKGKLEGGETVEEAAVREVEEESGITKLQIIRALAPTFHTYRLAKKRMLKKTHWFLMKTLFDGPGKPQEKEDISKVEWMTKEEVMEDALQNTYRSVYELLTGFLAALPG